jgi:hypothetical protein
MPAGTIGVMPAFAVFPVRFDSESKPTIRRVKSSTPEFATGSTIFVEIGANWETVSQLYLDWHWVECVVDAVDDSEVRVRLP